jgi:hypothetical protein
MSRMGGACLGNPCIREVLCAIWLLSLLIWSFWVFPSFCGSVPVPFLRPVALPFRQHLPRGHRHNAARPCVRLPREGCAIRAVFGSGLELELLRRGRCDNRDTKSGFLGVESLRLPRQLRHGALPRDFCPHCMGVKRHRLRPSQFAKLFDAVKSLLKRSHSQSRFME